MQFKSWSSNTLQVPKSLSTDCSAVKSVRDPASELGLHELSLAESRLPAKASKRQSNPCFSHNQEVCPAVSAIESMLGNLQPLSADLQNVVGTTAQRMDWSRPDDSLPFERTVWHAEEPRWSYRHGQIRTRWSHHLPGSMDYCPSLLWPFAQACRQTCTEKKSG